VWEHRDDVVCTNRRNTRQCTTTRVRAVGEGEVKADNGMKAAQLSLSGVLARIACVGAAYLHFLSASDCVHIGLARWGSEAGPF